MKSLIIFLLSIGIFSLNGYSQDKPLEVHLVNTLPTFPTTLAEFIEAQQQNPNFLFITVQNKTSSIQNYKITMSITNLDQNFTIKVESTEELNCLNIGPNEMDHFGNSEFPNLFNSSNLEIEGSNLTIFDLIADPTLAEGHYQICLWAISCEDENITLSTVDDLSCVDFSINSPNPPILMNICDINVSAESNNLTFNWIFDLPTGYMNDVTYDVRIYELDPEIPLDPNDLDFAVPPAFQTEVVNNKFINLIIPDDIQLNPEMNYAVRVKASGDGLNVKNNGYSEICVFYCVDNFDNIHFTLTPHYPADNAPTFFKNIPIVYEITPNCNDLFYEKIKNYSYQHFLISGSTTLDWQRSIPWNSGPTQSQKYILSGHDGNPNCLGSADFDCNRSCQISHNNPDQPLNLIKGNEYYSNVTGTLKYGKNKTQPVNSNTRFEVGMGKPSFSAPAKNDTFEIRKPITIRFSTTPRPEHIGPEHYIFHSDGDNNCSAYNDYLFERWHLQVSKTNSFNPSDIVYSKWEKIGSLTDDAFSFKNMYNNGVGERIQANEDFILDAFSKDITKEIDSLKVGKYYARVLWATNPNDTLDMTYYKASDTISFNVKGGPLAPISSGDRCIVQCIAHSPAISTPIEFPINKTFKINGFNVKVKSYTKNDINGYEGEGESEINFITNIKLKVKFDHISINTDSVAMTGKITGIVDQDLTLDSLKKSGKTYYGLTDESAQALHAIITTGDRMLDLLNDSPTNLPIGIDHSISEMKLTLGIVHFTTTTTTGNIRVMTAFKDPQISNMWISAGADICINANGYGDSLKFFIPHDIGVITEEAGTDFHLSGIENAENEDEGTYFSWNCDKDFKLNLAGKVSLDREYVVPEKLDGSIDEDETHKVVVRFNGKFELRHTSSVYDWGLIFGVNIPKFQIVGVDDWSFEVVNAYLDLSSLSNPIAFSFPENYNHPGVANQNIASTWKGLYIETAKVKTPEGLFGDNNRVEFTANKVLVVGSKLSFNLAITNLLNFNSNKANSGWGISLDTLQWNVLQNNVNLFRFSGLMSCPYFAENDKLEYFGGYQKKLFKDRNNQDSIVSYYGIFIGPKGDLHLPIGAANFVMDDTSYVSLNKSSVAKEWYVNATIAGGVDFGKSLGQALNAPSMSLVGRMEHFMIRNDTILKKPRFHLASPDKKLGNFPFTLDTIYLEQSGIGFNTIVQGSLSLMGSANALSASAKFKIHSSLSGSIRKFMTVDGFAIDSIGLDANVASIKIKGYIKWYKNGSTDGIKGRIMCDFPANVSGLVDMDFGTFCSNPNASFNTAQYFSYWEINAAINLPNPIPVFAGFNMHSVFGGAFYHKKYNDDQRKYIADFSTSVGIKLGGRFATAAKPEAFNIDAYFEGSVNASGGLSTLGFHGNAWGMKEFSASDQFGTRVNPSIWGVVDINYTVATKTFNGDIDIYVLKKNGNTVMIKGNRNAQYLCSNAHFHVDPEEWYFYIGTQEERNKLKIDFGLNVNIDGYLMVGFGIPAELPPLPQAVIDIISAGVSSGDEGGMQMIENTAADSRDPSLMSSGQGFALGGSIDINVPEFTFLILYAKLRFIAGFDFNMVNTGEVFCTNTGENRGLDNWYASGQIYAAIDGDLGLKINFWGSHKISLVHLKAGIMVQGGTPNPSYFSGMASVYYSVLNGWVSGSSSFAFNFGKKCVTGSNNPLDGITYIADMKPTGSASVFDNVKTSFNFPINTKLTLPVSDNNGNITGSVDYMPFIYTYEVKLNGSNIIGSINTNSNKLISTFINDTLLKPNKTYTATIKLRVKNMSTNQIVKNANGTYWEESKTVTFTTGSLPDVIPIDQVYYSSPLPYQRYFLKYETQNNAAFINFKSAIEPFMMSSKTYSGIHSTTYHYKYFIRITGVGHIDTIEQAIPNNTFNFFTLNNIGNLKNDKKYKLELIRKIQQNNNSGSPYQIAMDQINISELMYASPIAISYNDQRVKAQMNVIGGKFNETPPLKRSQFAFFTLFFGTSKYNSMSSKNNNTVTSATRLNCTATTPDSYLITTRWNEPFDYYDFKKYNENVPPLITIFTEIQPNTGTSGSGLNSYRDQSVKYIQDDIIAASHNKNVTATYYSFGYNNSYVAHTASYKTQVIPEGTINYTIDNNLISGYSPKYTDSDFRLLPYSMTTGFDQVYEVAIEPGPGTGSSGKPLYFNYQINRKVLNKAFSYKSKKENEWNKKISPSTTKVNQAFPAQYQNQNLLIQNWYTYINVYPCNYSFPGNSTFPLQFIYRKYTPTTTRIGGTNTYVYGTKVLKSFGTYQWQID